MNKAAFWCFLKAGFSPPGFCGWLSGKPTPAPAMVFRFIKNAVTTVAAPMVRNKGEPMVRICAVSIPAAAAEMAGAPWMTKS